jgi:hypothetical protein
VPGLLGARLAAGLDIAAVHPHGFALVAAADGTLLGRLGEAVLDADPVARAEQVREAGPSTVRADRPWPSWPSGSGAAACAPRASGRATGQERVP